MNIISLINKNLKIKYNAAIWEMINMIYLNDN